MPSTPFGPVKQINAGVLNAGYADRRDRLTVI
jgi:hypothetical protein